MSDDEREADQDSTAILYQESKATADVVDQLLIRYRTNTTTVLTLSTAAATLFGFSTAPKGPFFLLALIGYGVGIVFALKIYSPKSWRDGIFKYLEDSDGFRKPPPKSPTRLRCDLTWRYQNAIADGMALRTLQAKRFRVLLFTTACVVIFAGINSYVATQQPSWTQGWGRGGAVIGVGLLVIAAGSCWSWRTKDDAKQPDL